MLNTYFQHLPEKLETMKHSINSKIMLSIYKKFDFNYLLKTPELSDEFIKQSLIDFLKGFMFATYYMIPSKKTNNIITNEESLDTSDAIICVENQCIIIESISNSLINDAFKEIKACINVNKPSSEEISSEIQSFCSHYHKEINFNEFIKITIRPIICYLIRRYYYPSNYFKDNSFFYFNSSSVSNDKKFKDKFKYFFAKENEGQLFILPYHIQNLFDELQNENHETNEQNTLLEFNKKDFIPLRTLYGKTISKIELVMNINNLHIFVMKTFTSDTRDLNLRFHEIDFCEKYSNRCFMKCHGFIKENQNITRIIYDFYSNQSFYHFLKMNEANEINAMTVIIRLYQGIRYLQENKLIHRDLKTSNILIDHDFVPYISDFETIRDEEGETFTTDISTPKFSSPEQQKSDVAVSFPADIYSFGKIIKKLTKKLSKSSISSSLEALSQMCIKDNPDERATLDQIQHCISDILFNFYFQNKFIMKKIKEIDRPHEIIQLFFENAIFLLSSMKKADICSLMTHHIIFFIINEKSKHENISKLIFSIASSYIYPTSGKEEDKNYKLGRKYLKMGSLQNDSIACALLGNFYLTGEGGKMNYTKAAVYYTLAEKLDNIDARRILGCLSFFRNKYERGIQLFEKSNPQEDEKILYSLGAIYYQGYGVEKDYTKALKYFQLADEKNFPFATYNLGVMYFSGIGVKIDYNKAFELFKKISDRFTYACYYLGIIYQDGFVQPKDFNSSIFYLEKAAKENIGCSKVRLGLLYYEKGDYEKAKEYFELSAQENNPEAFFKLGEFYYEGKAVEPNYVKSKEYFEKSALQGYSEGIFRLGLLYYKGQGVPRNCKKSFEYFSISSEKENYNAYFYKALQYENGKGVEQSICDAIELYTKCTNVKEFEAIVKSKDGMVKDSIVHDNKYYYRAYNNLALIYFTEFGDIESFFEKMKKAGLNEFPIGQNNLALYYQYFGNHRGNALYLYDKASKSHFAIAEYNLGYLYEEDNDIQKAIEHYIIASNYEDEPIVFRGEVIDDDEFLNISKSFIICLTNMKLAKHFILQMNLKNAKDYMLKSLLGPLVMLASQLDDNSLEFKFKYNQENSTNVKDFILNSPLFNFKVLENSDWTKIDHNGNEKNQQIIIHNELSHNLEETSIPNDFSDQLDDFKIKELLEIKDEIELNLKFKENNNDSKKREIRFDSQNANKEQLIDFLQEIVDSIFDNISEAKQEIDEIIQEMSALLHTYPYYILFGRIQLNHKNDEDDDGQQVDIDKNFYDGFSNP